jgi:isopenicillin-N epimerase
VVQLPWPANADEIVARFEAAAEGVRLAIVDHITSPTAIVLPLERIVRCLHERGALVIVDGAHAVGQVALDVPATGADWYASNAHKWLYAPKGSAFLYAAPAVAVRTRPLVISHHVAMGFPRSFDWVGTRDTSAWLSVPAAIRFHQRFDREALRAHGAHLLALASEAMDALGADPVAPLELCGSMRSFVLPVSRAITREDAHGLMRELWTQERIQVAAMALGGRLLLRVSAQAYVDEEDVRALGDALVRVGWPGRQVTGSS